MLELRGQCHSTEVASTSLFVSRYQCVERWESGSHGPESSFCGVGEESASQVS